MSQTIVPPDGPLTAYIALIGQNPGKTEINPYVLKPFQGYSGNLLKKWWAALDPPLHREEIYVDNLIPYMCDPEQLSEQELRYWETELHKRLALLSQVRVIVPVGNYSCFPLVGKGAVKGASKKDRVGISSLRGSIYSYTNPFSGHTCKVIPTLHPSALFARDNSGRMGVTKGVLEKRVFRDWQRIAYEATFDEIQEPRRTYIIDPMESDVADFTQRVESAADQCALAIDIETPSGAIDCVGFSYDPSFALVIPTTTNRERDTFFPYIRRLCESNSQKIFQNGCVPGDVEVLTKDYGWLRIDRFRDGLDVAQWDIKTGNIEFVPALLHVERGGVQVLTVAANHHRCQYTLDHRMVIAPHKGKKDKDEHAWLVFAAKDAQKLKRFEIPTAGTFLGGFLKLPFARFLVAAQADGAIRPTSVHFNFKKERKIERLFEICHSYGIEVTERSRSAEGERAFVVKGEAAEVAWTYFGETKEWGKWLLDLTYETRLEILNELQHWDGCGKGKGFIYFTSIPDNKKWISALASITGFGSRSTAHNTVFITPRNRVTIQSEHWQQGPYRGSVYCLKTRTGFFLARSKERTFITGNCYDTFWLANYGIHCNNYLWDLLYAHVVADPINNHSLDFLSSIYLPFHRYWKDHAKADEESWRTWTENKEDLLTYNGMDACITRELLDYIHADLCERGVLEAYLQNVQPLFEPLLEISLAGIKVDAKAQARLREEALKKAEDIREALAQLAGEDLIAKNGFSPTKLQRFFHETLGLPKQYKITKKAEGKSKSVSLDATNLAKLAHRYPAKAKIPAQMVVDYRSEVKKLESWLNPAKQDADGYVRAQYRPVTEACRLASSAHPMGRAIKEPPKKAVRRKKGDPPVEKVKLVDRGYNLQNTKREVREIYVPDEGCLLLEIDQSAVESRLGNMYCATPRMVELANRHPSVFDQHTHNATTVFRKPEGQISKRERFLGKIVSHGSIRGMSGKKLSDNLLTYYDMLEAPEDCQKMIDTFLEENWEFPKIYFPYIRGEIMGKGRLINTWGDVWDVRGENLDDDLYRRGYSFLPQSEASRMMLSWGLVPTHRYLKSNWSRLRARINIPRHDALIISVPFESLYEVCVFVLASLERPRLFFGNQLIVPCSIKVGINDAHGKEFKALPSRDDFLQQVEAYLKK